MVPLPTVMMMVMPRSTSGFVPLCRGEQRFEASGNMDMRGDTLEKFLSPTRNPNVQIQEELLSSSQSLYSFPHTSDGNMDPDVEDV